MKTQKLEFAGASGAMLAARLDIPDGPLRGYALFAHCFTCSKDLRAVRRIAGDLGAAGIAVLRFDFTGLGSSEGEFASTNFTSNLGDLLSAADYLRRNFEAPSVLIGHSLGGAAVLAVAKDVPEVRAVVTIGAPASAAHALHNIGSSVEAVERDGEAEVAISGRKFVIRKQFVDDLRAQAVREAVTAMKKPLLILHSPLDQIVGIDNATDIFLAARHPKSFVSLDKADHLLSDGEDAGYAAQVIVGWLAHYVTVRPSAPEGGTAGVHVIETGEGKFQNRVVVGAHRLFADEPVDVGGQDTGPSPYDYLSIALGACTSMTLRLYAERKKLGWGRIRVDVSHDKIHAKDCEDCADEVRESGGRIDVFHRHIVVEGEVSEEMRAKVLEIADKCPVHRTLEASSKIRTDVAAVPVRDPGRL
ncbi:MAG: bifunctional alpha/beta hydrolase/OsmC family protein [Parvibaculum sp.]|nr:bifunctional alpha/beta hydrolase/OsmC family protein [Parvibaculum sp.]